jgi:hypothetical protein
MIEPPVSCVLVRHEKGNVLFDTGYHPAAAEDPQGRWGGLAKMMMPIMRPRRQRADKSCGSRDGPGGHRHRRLLAPSRSLRLQSVLQVGANFWATRVRWKRPRLRGQPGQDICRRDGITVCLQSRSTGHMTFLAMAALSGYLYRATLPGRRLCASRFATAGSIPLASDAVSLLDNLAQDFRAKEHLEHRFVRQIVRRDPRDAGRRDYDRLWPRRCVVAVSTQGY